jgi:peptidoglycan/xylan/chitin deacetylase (PgdA/CDA1 family)
MNVVVEKQLEAPSPSDVTNERAVRWRSSARYLATHAAMGLSSVLGTRLKDAFGILTYHRIATPTGTREQPTWNVPPALFREQLAGLLACGYQAWPLQKVLEYRRAGNPVPRKTFVVTFDDGYESVYRHAWPVLRELNIPATIFLATAYLDSDGPFPFDDWTLAGSAEVSADSWRPLSTSQCLEMCGDRLVELGTHTHTHETFRGRPEALRQDLLASLDVLRVRFGISPATFAFPFGICGPELSQAAKDAGVLCSLTTQSELVTRNADPFSWGRFNANANDTARTLAAKLDGWYSLARGVWLRLKR